MLFHLTKAHQLKFEKAFLFEKLKANLKEEIELKIKFHNLSKNKTNQL